MTSPKHLWSGDWRQESAAARERAGRELPLREPAEPPPPPPPVDRGASGSVGALIAAVRTRGAVALVVALGVLLIAGGVYGVSALLGSGGPSAASAGGPAPWLGAQMESLAPGGVVIATVASGGPAEQAGLEPGDVISAINNRPINTVDDVRRAVGALRAGETISIQVSRGSTILNTDLTIAAQPRERP
jgi:membrane-associated protease RseP (regulator of RpoE activity)